jgi:hypothetical protein
MNPKEKETPKPDASGGHGTGLSDASVDAGLGGGAMPSSLDDLDASDPLGGGARPDPASAGDAGRKPRSAVVAKILGNVAGLPFDAAAVYTGHNHWPLEVDEKALMSEAVEGVVNSYGVDLDAKSNPWSCLVLGLVGFGVPRLVKELSLIRVELAEQNKRKSEA